MIARKQVVERTVSLHEQRLGAVLAALKGSGAHRVLDLGCGEGRLLAKCSSKTVSFPIFSAYGRFLSRSWKRPRTSCASTACPRCSESVFRLLQGSLDLPRRSGLEGYDAAAVVEVIEHLDPPRLAAFGRAVFEFARPGTVVVTTPNVEYNPKFETLPAGQFRHKDHRFEWTRAEFASWADGVCTRFGYRRPLCCPIGPVDAAVGAPSQMAVFEKMTA